MRNRRWVPRRLLAGFGLLAVLGGLVFEVALYVSARFATVADLVPAYSYTLHARDGTLLTMTLSDDDMWRLPARPGTLPDDFVAMLLAYEDKRFFDHDGIDRLALVRGVWQAAWAGRIVSGGSTLTMQLARLTNGTERSIAGKWRQMVLARALEHRYDKATLLAAYLDHAPYGGNIEGIEAAAQVYFGRMPGALSLAEKALLVALPQSPEARRPDLNPDAALVARNHVLDRLEHLGAVSARQVQVTRLAPLTARRRPPPGEGRHLFDLLTSRHPQVRRFDTGIDVALQRKAALLVERIAPEHGQAAAVVASLEDGVIRAYVGGRARLDAPAGSLDMLLSPRSPGSTLKPFVYAMTYEARIAHPQTIAHDGPVDIAGYAPRNYNTHYRGDMTLETALRRSINTIAVKLAAKVGARPALQRLSQVATGLQWAGDDPGIAYVLGGCSMPPLDLLRLYMVLGNGGLERPIALTGTALDGEKAGGRRIFDADAVWAVTDTLAGSPLPPGRMPTGVDKTMRRIAFKTGTSYGGRDAWAAGYDRDHAVVIWTGRPDASPVPDMLGLWHAAPALHDVFAALPAPRGDVAGIPHPDSALAPREQLPPRWRRLEPENAHRRLQIVQPKDSAIILATPDISIPLSARGGRPPYAWYADGVALDSASHLPRYRPQGPGAARFSVIDAAGATAAVSVWFSDGAEESR